MLLASPTGAKSGHPTIDTRCFISLFSAAPTTDLIHASTPPSAIPPQSILRSWSSPCAAATPAPPSAPPPSAKRPNPRLSNPADPTPPPEFAAPWPRRSPGVRPRNPSFFQDESILWTRHQPLRSWLISFPSLRDFAAVASFARPSKPHRPLPTFRRHSQRTLRLCQNRVSRPHFWSLNCYRNDGSQPGWTTLLVYQYQTNLIYG